MQRCYPPIPPETDFVILREKVLALYSQPYDARYPVICRDEQPKPLRADQRPSQPARLDHPATYGYEYVRCGTCTIWMFVEPLGQWRTAVDWAHRQGYRGSSALPPGRALDPRLRQSEHPYLRLFFPGLSARRGAPPSPARTVGVYASARQLAQHG